MQTATVTLTFSANRHRLANAPERTIVLAINKPAELAAFVSEANKSIRHARHMIARHVARQKGEGFPQCGLAVWRADLAFFIQTEQDAIENRRRLLRAAPLLKD